MAQGHCFKASTSSLGDWGPRFRGPTSSSMVQGLSVRGQGFRVEEPNLVKLLLAPCGLELQGSKLHFPPHVAPGLVDLPQDLPPVLLGDILADLDLVKVLLLDILDLPDHAFPLLECCFPLQPVVPDLLVQLLPPHPHNLLHQLLPRCPLLLPHLLPLPPGLVLLGLADRFGCSLVHSLLLHQLDQLCRVLPGLLLELCLVLHLCLIGLALLFQHGIEKRQVLLLLPPDLPLLGPKDSILPGHSSLFLGKHRGPLLLLLSFLLASARSKSNLSFISLASSCFSLSSSSLSSLSSKTCSSRVLSISLLNSISLRLSLSSLSSLFRIMSSSLLCHMASSSFCRFFCSTRSSKALSVPPCTP
mmetsp:Transcript_18259/g.28344  ORF Transcript_18259/g.28344 Transcript_18259/m.28344 type:complete len:359 (+) Transcript_18259:53-1129(+)